MKLTTPHIRRRIGSSKICRVCVHMHGVTTRKLSTNGNQKEDELLLDTDNPFIALYIRIALGCLGG